MPQPSPPNAPEELTARHTAVAQLYQTEFDTLDAAFGAITATAVRVMAARRASVWLFADDDVSLYCVYECDCRSHREGVIRKNTDKSLLYLVQDEAYMGKLRKEPVVEVNVTSQYDSASLCGGDTREREPCSMLDVPVRVDGRIIGVLCHDDKPGRTWQDSDRVLAIRLGYITALAVGNDRQQRATSLGEKYRALVEQTSDSVALGDSRGMLKYLNPPARRLLGLAPDEPIEAYSLTDFMTAESADFMRGHGLLLAGSSGGWTGNLGLCGRRGHEFEANMTITVYRDSDDGHFDFISCVVRDVSGHATLERRLAETQAQYEAALTASSDALFRLDVQTGRLKQVSAELCRMLGYTAVELESMTVFDLVGDTPERIRHHVNTVFDQGYAMLGERQYRHKDGHYVDLEVSAMLRDDEPRPTFSVHVRDISERQRRRRDVERLAFRDPYTGLPNGNLLRERADTLLSEVLPGTAPVAYVITQVDRWQRYASTAGYEVAELLLQQVAGRLRQAIGNRDIFIARLQVGAAFGLLFKSEEEDAEKLAVDIRQAFSAPFQLERETIHLAVRSGIAFFPAHAVSFKDLAKRAGLALRDANLENHDYCIFKPTLSGRLHDERLLEEDLRKAIGTSQIQLHYQPIIASREGNLLSGVEALAVWQHPQEGEVQPNEFFALAEDSNLIAELDGSILLKATQAIAQWFCKATGFTLSFNCSALTLTHPQFMDTLHEALEMSGLAPSQLCLEITETALMRNLETAAGAVREVRALGVKVSLDDFGTGYSSLAYLKDLAVDELKIDRDFVRGIGMDVRDERTIETIVSLGRDLGLRVVAEGVETWAQKEWLCSRRVDLLQGFYFGRPQELASLRRHYGDSTLAG